MLIFTATIKKALKEHKVLYIMFMQVHIRKFDSLRHIIFLLETNSSKQFIRYKQYILLTTKAILPFSKCTRYVDSALQIFTIACRLPKHGCDKF